LLLLLQRRLLSSERNPLVFACPYSACLKKVKVLINASSIFSPDFMQASIIKKVGMVLNHKYCAPEQYRKVLTPYQNDVVFCNICSSGYIVILIAVVCF